MESIENIIERFKIDVKHTSIPEKELTDAKFLLIRHGYSILNHQAQVIGQEFGE